MSKSENVESLLIDFDNLSVGEPSSRQNNDKNTPVNASIHQNPSNCNAIFGTPVPLYKLFNSDSADMMDDNNPFDQVGKKAALLDDPFEIAENAALVNPFGELKATNVETGTLIAFDGLTDSKTIDLNNENLSKLDNMASSDFIQEAAKNTSQTSQNSDTFAAPVVSSRSKNKNTSLNLLKYSLSNSRLDANSDKGSPLLSSADEESFYQKKHARKGKASMRRDSSADDSFDDIWATKPNLIDSETDIDSDIDSDIAKLNIPMLNKTIQKATPGDKNQSNENESDCQSDGSQAKGINRDKLLEKLASIKLKIPSPEAISTPSNHNQTTEKVANATADDEPFTPKSQYSAILPQHQMQPDNLNSLIENLKKIVDQCNNKSKQNEAKHLLDNLSSIFTHTNANESRTDSTVKRYERTPPQPIKRQGTFSIEKNDVDQTKKLDVECSITPENEQTPTEPKAKQLNPNISEMVKQIQSMLNTNQNINVMQTGDSGTNPTINPIFLVMAHSTENGRHSIVTRESFSRNTREYNKVAVKSSIPPQRPKLVRRSSFGSITRPPNVVTTPKLNENIEKAAKPIPKLVRRRSFQGSILNAVSTLPMRNVETTAAPKPAAPSISRRRSFNCAPLSSGIRSPSPKAQPIKTAAVTRTNSMSSSGAMRRKSLLVETASKESPQKNRTSYGILKKSSMPPAQRDLKIRVTKTLQTGRSTAPMRAIIPISRVAPMLMNNETVSPIDEKRSNHLITSTPRTANSSIGKGIPQACSTPPLKVYQNESYLSMSPNSKLRAQLNIAAAPSNIGRRRTLSSENTSGKNVSVEKGNNSANANVINQAKTLLGNGIAKFGVKRVSGIGLKKLSFSNSKENKNPDS